MITTIKTTSETINNVQSIIEELNAIVYIEKDKSPLECFKEMLDIEFDDYRFHLSDNVLIADNLKEYLPKLIKFMNLSNVHLLSLSGSPLKRLTAEFFVGKRIAEYRNDRYLLHDNTGVIYSKKFVNYMKGEINNDKKTIVDEVSFINFVLGKYGIIGYIHLPTLVNTNNDLNKQSSNLFDKNFITNL